MNDAAMPGLEPWQPHGDGLRAYHDGERDAQIVVHDDFERQAIPVRYFFRAPRDFPHLETKALSLARGRTLDVGAGTGCHALALQNRSLEVTAIDILPESVGIMRSRGVRDARQVSIYDFHDEPFETLLFMMNGLGIAETLSGMSRLLDHARRLLKPNGQILADSADLRPKWQSRGLDRGALFLDDGRYVGELHVQLEFAGKKGPPFQHLYVDPDTLAACAHRAGWDSEMILQPDSPSFLARLVPG